jgi:hypothetical protein
LGIYGQPFGKPVKKPYLQHRIGVVFRHRPIWHQLNNCMKTLREMIDLIESAQTPVAEGIPNDLTPYEAGEAAGLSGEYYENPYPEGSKRHAEFRLGWRDGTKQAEANRDIDEDQATAKMGLMSAMGSNDNNPADQRRAMAQQAVEQLAAKR